MRPFAHRTRHAELPLLPALLALLALFALASGGPACSSATGERTGKYAATREVMHTIATLTVIAPSSEQAARGLEAGFAALDSVDHWMNAYDPASELARVNAGARAAPVAVGPETFAVIERALHFSRATDGAFDITVGPLIALWRRAAEAQRLPTPTALERVRAQIGSGRVDLDRDARTVLFLADSVRLDLGGIAKGFAIDEAVEALRGAGIAAGIVEVGGDLRCFGRLPASLVGVAPDRLRGGVWATPEVEAGDVRSWPLGVQDPFSEGLLGKIRVPEGAVATSGHYRRYSEIEGRRYSHILDPRTGWPVADPASVTVIAPSALEADALATAISVLGLEAGLALAAARPGVEALVVSGGPEAPRIARTPGFPTVEPLSGAGGDRR